MARTGLQRPSLVTPHVFAADVDIEVTYTASAAETLTITLASLIRFNNLSGTGEDLLTYVIEELNAESIHTWAGADPLAPGATPGRTQIRCTPTTGDVATITIPAALGLLLGFDTTTPAVTIDGADSVITSAHTRAGLWIPGPQEEVYITECFARQRRQASLTMGAAGPLVNDVYGTATPFVLSVDRFNACFAFDDYAAQPEFVSFDPALTAADPNLSFEALCARWAVVDGLQCRLYPDHTDTSEFFRLQPDAWVNDPSSVLRKAGRNARLHYNLTIEAYKV